MTEYYLLNGQDQVGPCSGVQIAEMRAKGILGGDDYLWREGMPDWVTIESAFSAGGELAPLTIEAGTVAAPAASVPEQPESLSTNSEQDGQPIDFFAKIDWKRLNIGRIGAIVALFGLLFLPLAGFGMAGLFSIESRAFEALGNEDLPGGVKF